LSGSGNFIISSGVNGIVTVELIINGRNCTNNGNIQFYSPGYCLSVSNGGLTNNGQISLSRDCEVDTTGSGTLINNKIVYFNGTNTFHPALVLAPTAVLYFKLYNLTTYDSVVIDNVPNFNGELHAYYNDSATPTGTPIPLIKYKTGSTYLSNIDGKFLVATADSLTSGKSFVGNVQADYLPDRVNLFMSVAYSLMVSNACLFVVFVYLFALMM